MSEQTPNTPQLEFRAGGITITPTASRKQQTGRAVRLPIFRLEKWYKDQTSGDWRKTSTFLLDELPKLALVAMKTYEYFALQVSENRAAGAAANHDAGG